MNYARHTKEKVEVFFDEHPSDIIGPWDQWAFYAIPTGIAPAQFTGRIIGESPDQRCRRMKHAPRDRQCVSCPTKAVPRVA